MQSLTADADAMFREEPPNVVVLLFLSVFKTIKTQGNSNITWLCFVEINERCFEEAKKPSFRLWLTTQSTSYLSVTGENISIPTTATSLPRDEQCAAI